MSVEYSPDDMMTVAASRSLRDGSTCFVGIGLPSTAANLARRTHAPELVLIYESGTLGAKPDRLPLSIGDGVLADTADSVVSVPEVFNYWLQPGRIDTGFLGGAQIDRYGKLNTTVIGEYDDPKVRLPGAGGAPEIATSCREVLVVMRQTPRAFVPAVDFVTSAVHGPLKVITDYGILEPDADRELVLTQLNPDVDADQARAATGWELRVGAEPTVQQPPTEDELAVLGQLRATLSKEGAQ